MYHVWSTWQSLWGVFQQREPKHGKWARQKKSPGSRKYIIVIFAMHIYQYFKLYNTTQQCYLFIYFLCTSKCKVLCTQDHQEMTQTSLQFLSSFFGGWGDWLVLFLLLASIAAASACRTITTSLTSCRASRIVTLVGAKLTAVSR